MTKSTLALYQKYFVDREFERRDLFQIIADRFTLQCVLYPGSFVHITPSFIFPEVVYVDNDRQARQFFDAPETDELIAQKKNYSQMAQVRYHFADYRNGFAEDPDSFDLLISQYAGFVGQDCKKYLKTGGLLLANNSHGDAGLAAIDRNYQLIGVFFLRKGKYSIRETNLDEYFVPKSPIRVTKEYLEKLQKGIAYKRVGNAYLFRKVTG
ncbi:hypothetical protein GF407_10055 [candidate division KSB1 bacterium]|nr:hypothetical protein [candidate division KSB1 bacterium]